MESLLNYLGKLLKTFAFILLLPFAASLVLFNPDVVIAIGITLLLSLVLGFFLDWKFEKTELSVKDAFVMATIAWLVISLLGAIPYVMVLHLSVVDALFESISGYTTTGMSVLTPEEVPRALLFYRSYTQWIGGVGVVLLFITVASPLGVASRLYMAEGRTERLEPSIVNTSQRIFYIYALLTLFGALALYLAGLSVFEASNYVLTAIATGGFSTRSTSFADFGTVERAVAIVIMILGATSFAVHQRIFQREFSYIKKNIEVKVMLLLIILGTILLLRELNPVDAIFQATTSLSCTGLATVKISELSQFSKIVLIALMFTGGSYGSTAGAIKIIRLIVVLKSIQWYVSRVTSPRGAIIPFKIGNRVFKEEEVFYTLTYVLLYFLFISIGTGIFVYFGHPLVDALFDVTSAQGNVGLNAISGYTTPEKVLLMFHMIVGRLEIVPVLVLLSSWRRR